MDVFYTVPMTLEFLQIFQEIPGGNHPFPPWDFRWTPPSQPGPWGWRQPGAAWRRSAPRPREAQTSLGSTSRKRGRSYRSYRRCRRRGRRWMGKCWGDERWMGIYIYIYVYIYNYMSLYYGDIPDILNDDWLLLYIYVYIYIYIGIYCGILMIHHDILDGMILMILRNWVI